MSWTDVMPTASRFSLENTEMATGTVCTSAARFSAVTTTVSICAKAGTVKAVVTMSVPKNASERAPVLWTDIWSSPLGFAEWRSMSTGGASSWKDEPTAQQIAGGCCAKLEPVKKIISRSNFADRLLLRSCCAFRSVFSIRCVLRRKTFATT
jgi:hypothetical protein